MIKSLIFALTAIAVTLVPSIAATGSCTGLPGADQLRELLNKAPNEGGDAGGLFHGKREWAAVVNRKGELCAIVTSTSGPTQVWPGSEPIAKSEAFTANAFSLDSMPLSTTRLYTLTQPGHSLYGTAFASPFNPQYLGTQEASQKIEGGAIAFGGGLPRVRETALPEYVAKRKIRGQRIHIGHARDGYAVLSPNQNPAGEEAALTGTAPWEPISS